MAESFTSEDIVYHAPGGAPLLARLYRPAGPGPWPAVVDVHGGRWCAESRLTNAAIDAHLASRGVFVMALDFRMPPDARYPAPVADINFALRWLRFHAADLNVRPEWIGGVGTSSGGHQLMLNVLRPDDFRVDHKGPEAAASAMIHYAVFCWPVSDPPARYAYARERGMDIHIASHDAYWRDVAQMEEGSPLRLVQDRQDRTLPPALMVQGDADVVLSPGMTERFVAAWRAAGGTIEDRFYPGEGHTFITKAPESAAARAALDHIVAFILQHTKGA